MIHSAMRSWMLRRPAVALCVAVVCTVGVAEPAAGRTQVLAHSSSRYVVTALAENSAGDAVLVFSGNKEILFAAFAPRGRPFGRPFKLRGRVGFPREVAAAIDPRGRVVIAAIAGFDSASVALAARGSVKRGVSRLSRISLAGDPALSSIKAAAGPRGTAVGWVNRSLDAQVVDAPWRKAFGLPVDPTPVPLSSLIGLGIDRGGRRHAVWLNDSAGVGAVFEAVDAGAGFGGPLRLAARSELRHVSSATIDARGATRMFWAGPRPDGDPQHSSDPQNSNLFALTHEAGAPSSAEQELGRGDSFCMVIGSSANGHALAAWRSQPGGQFAASGLPGQPFGAIRQLTPDDGCPQAAAVGDSGRGAVISTGTGPTTLVLVDAHANVITRVRLDRRPGDTALVSVDRRGRATAVWSNDGDGALRAWRAP